MKKTLAAIDIGTNSFHLIVVRVNERGNFEIIDREKEVIRLGEGSAGDIKFIKEEAIQRALITLARFKGIADSHGAKVRAVATSAVREAHNRNDFINRALSECGVEIEIVSGNEEARLIYLGILKAVPVFEKKALVIDIGGGSTEFLLGEKGEYRYALSLKLGAVRLTQKFFPDYNVTASRVKECRKWIEGELFAVSKYARKEHFELSVGSSGTIMAAGLMIQSRKKKEISSSGMLNNFEFTRAQLFEIEEEILKHKTASERGAIPGLDQKRADIIPAGIIILAQIFRQFNLKKMTISEYALREGIIIDSLQKQESKGANPKLSNIRLESITHLTEIFKFDYEHCAHVTNLSLQIFDQMKELHQLDNMCREYLEAAGRLHDIGYHISHSDHHRHSHYIIMNSELLGFNENEVGIIANIARYHRKSHPKPNHTDFVALPEKSKNIVMKLASILRVADSLDRTHQKKVKKIKVEITPKHIDFYLNTSSMSIDIELWNLERRKALFEMVYGRALRCKI